MDLAIGTDILEISITFSPIRDLDDLSEIPISARVCIRDTLEPLRCDSAIKSETLFGILALLLGGQVSVLGSLLVREEALFVSFRHGLMAAYGELMNDLSHK